VLPDLTGAKTIIFNILQNKLKKKVTIYLIQIIFLEDLIVNKKYNSVTKL
jgi:hypothetical protein